MSFPTATGFHSCLCFLQSPTEEEFWPFLAFLLCKGEGSGGVGEQQIMFNPNPNPISCLIYHFFQNNDSIYFIFKKLILLSFNLLGGLDLESCRGHLEGMEPGKAKPVTHQPWGREAEASCGVCWPPALWGRLISWAIWCWLSFLLLLQGLWGSWPVGFPRSQQDDGGCHPAQWRCSCAPKNIHIPGDAENLPGVPTFSGCQVLIKAALRAVCLQSVCSQPSVAS